MRRKKDIPLICLWCFLCTTIIHAKIKLPSIFSDNMVLQQQTDIQLSGEATPLSIIQITPSWNGRQLQTKSDSSGKWSVPLSTPRAGGPYEIKISDEEELTLTNILIGEIWFCAGQSNMEMPLKGFDRQAVENTNDIIAKAKPSVPIRIFNTDREKGVPIQQFSNQPQRDCIGEWLENTSANVAKTSAVAYFFASYIQEVLEIPVGIITSTWGGSRVEAWMSQEALEEFPAIDTSHFNQKEPVKDPGSTAGVLFNAKIAPFINFPIKGLLWYQGESNRDNPELYSKLVPAFVKDLRHKWGSEIFPFYYVQIAPYDYGDPNNGAAQLREVQLQHLKTIPNSGMVATLDVGSPNFIHPVDKKTVGHRLAYWALSQTYNREGFGYCGPIYESQEIVGNKIYINFKNAPHGTFPMWTPLEYFEIAGEDRVFYPAKAEVETASCRLAVSCDQVPNPVAVRYAYKDYTGASVYDNYGLPASPFRTDNW